MLVHHHLDEALGCLSDKSTPNGEKEGFLRKRERARSNKKNITWYNCSSRLWISILLLGSYYYYYLFSLSTKNFLNSSKTFEEKLIQFLLILCNFIISILSISCYFIWRARFQKLLLLLLFNRFRFFFLTVGRKKLCGVEVGIGFGVIKINKRKQEHSWRNKKKNEMYIIPDINHFSIP